MLTPYSSKLAWGGIFHLSKVFLFLPGVPLQIVIRELKAVLKEIIMDKVFTYLSSFLYEPHKIKLFAVENN